MSAAKRLSFKIPLQTEVQVYMKERKGWPDAFIIYYAEKFWNNYQSSGWKLSNGNAMKDWKAAFNSQWQNLKYKEDIEFFQRCGGRPEPAKVIHMMQPKQEPEPANDIQRLDKLLSLYTKSPTSYSIEKIAKNWTVSAINSCYQAIKENKVWCREITKADIEKYTDEKMLKCFVIVRTLDWYGCKGFSFSDTVKLRSSH